MSIIFEGDQYDYGKQRIWGSVGYGMTALVSGYAMDNFLGGYGAAVSIMLVFAIFDFISCMKLKVCCFETILVLPI